jgi:hypothetical protein
MVYLRIFTFFNQSTNSLLYRNITMFIITRLWIITDASWIQSAPSHPVSQSSFQYLYLHTSVTPLVPSAPVLRTRFSMNLSFLKRATRSVHLTLLDLIVLATIGEEHNLGITSFHSFLRLSVISSTSGLNTIPNQCRFDNSVSPTIYSFHCREMAVLGTWRSNAASASDGSL